MIDLFLQLTIIIVLSSVLGIFARFAKQPTIVAYLLAGILVGVFGFANIANNKEVFDVFADLGIMFLLFLVGLEINYETLRVVGRDALVIGVAKLVRRFPFRDPRSRCCGGRLYHHVGWWRGK